MFQLPYSSLCPSETAILHSGKAPEASGHVSHWLPRPCLQPAMLMSCIQKDPLHLGHLLQVFPSSTSCRWWKSVGNSVWALSGAVTWPPHSCSHQARPGTVKALLTMCLICPHLSEEQISFEPATLPVLKETEGLFPLKNGYLLSGSLFTFLCILGSLTDF